VLLRAILLLSFVLFVADVWAKASEVRYFAVWSYSENVPRDEIARDRVAEHRLGHWALEFDPEGLVIGGSYHAADGTVWMSLKYHEEEGRVYADLYGPSGQFLSRKSTPLRDRRPRWPSED
jgi:hypothetical protein